jgi:carbonic anhydrase
VLYNIGYILQHSTVLKQRYEQGQIAIVGAIYDVKTGQVQFLDS